jgi:hypothetical protein
LAVAGWFVVDWGTAGGFRPSYFATYMPALLVFYLGCPAVFTYLVVRRRFGTRALIAATVVEIVVYTPLTFFPLWIVRGELGAHRRLVWSLVAVELAVTLLTVTG